MPRRLPGRAIQAGTITVTQLETSVANTVQTGGGPKITNLQITDNTWAVLDDTAVDTAGGYVLITGTNFVSGALVYFNQTAANSVAFVSATTLRVTVPALTAGTYLLYVINPDGGTAIRVPGLTASASPAWQTGSNLGEQSDGAISLSLVATDATSYTLVSGSLPPGLSLNTSTGAITGTVTGVTVETTYTFTVRATDAQLQDSPRTFTVTITVSDPYFKLTTLLLSGSAISANTVIRDSSTNNFNLTVAGDARASNFTPYGTGWSVYFDGSGDYLTIPDNVALRFGTGDFDIEFWYNGIVGPTNSQFVISKFTAGSFPSQMAYVVAVVRNDHPTNPRGISVYLGSTSFLVGSGNIQDNTWYHIAVTRESGSVKVFINGTQVGTTQTITNDITNTSTLFIGASNDATSLVTGYVSNVRIVKGAAVYTANFTPATTNLTAVANTSLLTCNANRFLDSSTNNFTITRNGDARIVSFNPFNITNTGVNGSMYFDGTGDYLTVPNSTPVQLGTGDFEIDAWVYVSSLAATVLIDARSSATASAYTIGYNSSGFPYIYDGSTAPTGSSGITAGQWNYIVWTRASGTLRMFVNGTSVYSASNSISLTGAGTNLTICSIVSNGGQILTGYLGDLRIVKGAGITTSTVPTSPLTAIANTQLLTFQFDQPHNNHTFLDSSSNQFLITRNGNASQGTFSPFSQNGWSNYFNGSSSLQTASSSSLTFGTGDFSISFWIYPTVSTAGSNTGVMGIGPASNGTFLIYTKFPGYSDNTIFVAVYGGGSFSSSIPLNVNQWNHVAMSRASGTLSIYINGTRGANSSLPDNLTGSVASIGKPYYNLSVESYTGYLADIRFVKGTALYSGTSITVPTSPSALVAGTALLTSQYNRFYDGSGITTSFTIAGSPSVQAFSPFAATAIYNPAVHGGSAYFDGSGDYLTIGSTSDFILGTNDFCFEAWHYSLTGTDAGLIARRTGFAAVGWVLGPRKFAALLGGTWYDPVVGFASSFKKYEWVHTAVTRSGNNWRFFENGVLIDYQTRSGSVNDMTQYVVNIGRGASNTEEGPFTGYLTDATLTIGSIPTLYQTNVTTTSTQIFSVPTAPRTFGTNTNFLVKGTDAAILDSTGRNVVESLGDIKSSSVITKFTGASFVSDGSGDYLLTAPTADLEFGSGDFTIELWWYPTSTTRQGIYHGSFGADWCVGIDYSSVSTNQKVGIWASSNGSSWNLINADGGGNGIGTTSLTQNAWNHIAYVRNGTTWMLFVNGNRDLNLTGISGSIVNRATYRKAIGAWYSSGAMTQATGYLADLRITRYARYTANFTAPTVPARLK